MEFYVGYSWPIFTCAACGCRFTEYAPHVYDIMHSSEVAPEHYRQYRSLARECESLCKSGDKLQLRNLLCAVPKYRFIIEQVERLRPQPSNLLEIGCARGFLTSYFILAGYDIQGVDLSAEAVAAARASFGDHFHLAGSPAIPAAAPYDLIYHVGTIGCVQDPLGYTQAMLAMLKPGGLLLFNAPNLDACCRRGQLWVDGAPPPDVVTLYKPGFWTHRFAPHAAVVEHVDFSDPVSTFPAFVKNILGLKWRKPMPIPLVGTAPGRRSSLFSRASRRLDRAVQTAGRISRLAALAPRQPAEFGLFVRMEKS